MSLKKAKEYLRDQGFEQEKIYLGDSEKRKKVWSRKIKETTKKLYIHIDGQEVKAFKADGWYDLIVESETIGNESRFYRHKMVVNALINEEQKNIFKFEGFDRNPTPQGASE